MTRNPEAAAIAGRMGQLDGVGRRVEPDGVQFLTSAIAPLLLLRINPGSMPMPNSFVMLCMNSNS